MADERYMHRCIELAKQGAGNVAPNPMVGALLVHEDIIIGEGYHQQYGEAHAEVNAIADAGIHQATRRNIHQAAGSGQMDVISQSTLYVSLEPCAHYGKTPPCADLIIKYKIPKVVIGCRDPFKEVDGKGIEKLKAAGIEVQSGVLEKECKELNKRFFTFHTLHRPYIILKWAETGDGFMATSPQTSRSIGTGSLQRRGAYEDSGSKRLLISNEYSNRFVHKWRSEEAAILVGTNTVANDDPELTTRLWPGNSPVRLVVDMNLRLASSFKVFNGQAKTIIFNSIKHEEDENLLYYQVTEDTSLVHQIVNALYQLKIQSVIVEGGAKLLQSFIDEGIWDEARVISNKQLTIGNGLRAPQLMNDLKIEEQTLLSDTIAFYKNNRQ